MSGPIFVLNPKGDLVPIYEQPYETEDVFQKILAKYPELLLGSDERTPWSGLLLVAREQGVPIEEGGGDYFSLDHLFVDQNGVPTLVEVKRRSDTRNRREIVAQMLDYASNGLAYWKVEDLQQNFAETCAVDHHEPAAVLEKFLGERADTEGFWQQVQENIRNERIRMVFVADDISPELRRIVSFLNRQMRTSEMLAIELKQFVGEGVQAFVPDVIVKPDVLPPPDTVQTRWTEERFMIKLERESGPEVVPVAKALLDWGIKSTTKIIWGRGKIWGSFTPVIVVDGTNYNSICVWTSGLVDIQFQYLQNQPPFDALDKRQELARRLNAIPGVAIPDDALGRFPSVKLEVLLKDETRTRFLAVIEWVIAEMRMAVET